MVEIKRLIGPANRLPRIVIGEQVRRGESREEMGEIQERVVRTFLQLFKMFFNQRRHFGIVSAIHIKVTLRAKRLGQVFSKFKER